MLRPVADLCLQLGITSPEMERILRSVFVERAERLLTETRGSRRPDSDVRIALIIGVHRNFVRQIRATKPRVQLEKVQRRHRGDALLQAWATDWQFLTSAGLPRDLPMYAPEGEASFDALVRQCLPGVSTGTVMTELRRSGAIRQLPDERVRLRARTARPPGMTEASIAAAAQRLEQLAATQLHNLTVPDQPRFCEGLDGVAVDAQRLAIVRQTIARRAQNFLDSLAAELVSEAAPNSANPTVRVGLTVFSHESGPAERPHSPPRAPRGTKS
ncbi:MAG: DUF6502 family protein [Steroidobacteraceae bacterium]